MSMSVGRPVGPTYSAPTPPPAQVAQPTTTAPVAEESNQAANTQTAFGAARQSAVGKGTETINASQGSQQVKQGVEQTDDGGLLAQGQSLMENPLVQSEFGGEIAALPKLPPPTPPSSLPPPPPPPKAASEPAQSGGGSITPDMLVQARQGLKSVSQHQVLNLEKADTTVTESSRSIVLKDEGSAFAPERLTEKSTLEIVGHGAADGSTIGGLTPQQLANKLKSSGIKQLAVLDLKSCYSNSFKSTLESELRAAGIQIGEIKSYAREIAINHDTGKVMQSESIGSPELHNGVLGLDPTILQNIATQHNVTLERVKKIETFMEKNNGKYVTEKVGPGVEEARKIAADIIKAQSGVLAPAPQTGVQGIDAKMSPTEKRVDAVQRYMFKQINALDPDDDEAEYKYIDDLSRKDFEALCQKGGKISEHKTVIAVDFKQIKLDENITCHQFAYGKEDSPNFKPNCEDVISRANATGKPFAAYFFEGKLAHSAYQEGGVWQQALKVSDNFTTGTATAIFTTLDMKNGNYDPILKFDPSIPGDADRFRQDWKRLMDPPSLSPSNTSGGVTTYEQTLEKLPPNQQGVIKMVLGQLAPEEHDGFKRLVSNLFSNESLEITSKTTIIRQIQHTLPNKHPTREGNGKLDHEKIIDNLPTEKLKEAYKTAAGVKAF